MTYPTHEVYIQVQDHQRHQDDWSRSSSTAGKYAFGEDQADEAVAYALRDFADSFHKEPEGRRFNLYVCPVCGTTSLYPGQCVEPNFIGNRHEGYDSFITRDRLIVEEDIGAAGADALSRLQQPAGLPREDGEAGAGQVREVHPVQDVRHETGAQDLQP